MMNCTFGAPLSEFLTAEEQAAQRLFQHSLGFDVSRQPDFWERLVARIVGGETTGHKELYDVEVEIWERLCRIEVKSAHPFYGVFSDIRGRDYSRDMFKWALPRGYSGKNTADCIVLVGLDRGGLAYSWVLPREEVEAGCASISVTCPSVRRPATWSKLDRFLIPFTEMLPAIAAACHNAYDAKARAAGIRERRAEGQLSLLEERE